MLRVREEGAQLLEAAVEIGLGLPRDLGVPLPRDLEGAHVVLVEPHVEDLVDVVCLRLSVAWRNRSSMLRCCDSNATKLALQSAVCCTFGLETATARSEVIARTHVDENTPARPRRCHVNVREAASVWHRDLVEAFCAAAC